MFARAVRTRRLAALVAVAASCGLLFAGCGDGDDGQSNATTDPDAPQVTAEASGATAPVLGETVATPPVGETTGAEEVTVEQYIVAADSICRQTNEELATLRTPSTPEELAQGVRQGKVIAERQLARLRALEVPPIIADTVAAAYAVLDEQISRLDAVADAANDRDRLDQLIRELEELDAKADGLATEIGLTECSNDS